MILNVLHFKAGGQCKLVFDETDHWLQAIWSGLVDNHEAVQGAKAYLEKVPTHPCAYLLNDNQALHGPWFDSTEWLEHAWLPQAERLGLRYIAHLVQADTHADVLTLKLPAHVEGKIELQVFDKMEEAKEWLRACQKAD
ncbi:MAG: hypothetical protein ACRYF0_16555 [Janthinobacterium lividum]